MCTAWDPTNVCPWSSSLRQLMWATNFTCTKTDYHTLANLRHVSAHHRCHHQGVLSVDIMSPSLHVWPPFFCSQFIQFPVIKTNKSTRIWLVSTDAWRPCLIVLWDFTFFPSLINVSFLSAYFRSAVYCHQCIISGSRIKWQESNAGQFQQMGILSV